MDKFLFLLLWLYYWCISFGCLAQKDTLEEGSFNFDLETKSNSKLPSCIFDFNYNIAKASLSVICFAVGVFILLFGYKRRKLSFCFMSLTSISILSYLVLEMEQKFNMTINILIAASIGLLASLFSALLLYCGYFLMGLFAGFVVGILFLLTFSMFSSALTISVSCVIMAAFGLLQVFVTMWWRHRVYIVSSCLFAAAVTTCSLDYFVEGFFLLGYIEMKVFYHRNATLCWWTYLMFGMFVLFFVIGLIVQCCYTGKEVQKSPYNFIYQTIRRKKTRQRQRQQQQQQRQASQHDEENFLINNSNS